MAHELPFTIGQLAVDPPTRQIERGDLCETLEPRVMQVLVVLARAGGGIVTRDELIEWCWEGRIVGDDSINRALSRIRHIAAEIGGGTFTVETITKVGYKLRASLAHEVQTSSTEKPASAASERVLARRPLMVGLGAAAGAAVVGSGVWFSVSRQHQPAPSAKLYYQRGVEARGQASLTSGEQAVAFFRQATRLDPEYAAAWGALAWGYRSLLEYGPRQDAAHASMLAQSAARRALDLDADNADAQAALLLLKPFYRNWAEIEEGCRKLLARHPDHNITRYNLAHVMGETGRWREAVPHLQELSTREPFWPLARTQLFRALFCAGRLDEAEEQIQVVLRLWPRRLDMWSTRVRQLLLSGRTSEALAFLDNEAAQPPDSGVFIELNRLIARAYISGSSSLRQRAVAGLLDLMRSEPRAIVGAAVDCAFLGEVDLAFSLIEGFYFSRGKWAIAHPERSPTSFLFNVMTTPLRRDPRFEPLVEEIGLKAFWRRSGTRPDYRRFD